MRVIAWAAVAGIAATTLASCATPMTAGADYAPDVDLMPYGTFTWGEADGLPVGDPRLDNNPFFTDRLHAAIKAELERRNIREDANSPALLVHHHTSVRNHVEVYDADVSAGYTSEEYGAGTQVIEYEEGTFLVDIADAETKEILWRGWAMANVDAALDDPAEMASLMGRAVALMFEQFPVAPADAPSPLKEQMYGHFQAALELRAGALFGDDEMLASAGERLAAEPAIDALPPGSERFVRQMRQAATLASEATTGAQRRGAAADVARTCGECHKAYRLGPDFVVGGPAPGESLRMHMARQSRISRLLWDGLIGPSEATWAAGAAELANEPAFPHEIVSRVQDARVLDDAQEQLRMLGARAEQATDPVARSQVLARVWGVCAGCHQLAGALGPDV